jgi:hypothetical protein
MSRCDITLLYYENMGRRSFQTVLAIFIATTAAVVIPMWQLPYDGNRNFTFSSQPMVPGAIMLLAGTMYLIASKIAKARIALAVMAACAPLADSIIIARDISIDPTTHNLLPFEIAWVGVQGLLFVLPGLIIGLIARAVLRRKSV